MLRHTFYPAIKKDGKDTCPTRASECMTNKELDDTVIADRFSTPLWERETDEQKEGDNIPAKIDQGWHGLKYKDTGDASESAR